MRRRLAALLLALTASAAPAQAPTAVTIPDNPRADSVRLLPVARFGSIDDPVSPARLTNVVRDSRGYYYVGPTTEPGTIARYDARGRYRGTVGRRGSGPGEFQGIGEIAVGAGDSLYVYDRRNQRVTIIGPDFRVARHMGLPISSTVMAYGAGRLYFSGIVQASARSVHGYSLAGARQWSGGTDYVATTQDYPPADRTRALAGADGGVWSAPMYQYELEWLDATGAVRRTLTRTAPWFPRAMAPPVSIYEAPHPPYIKQLSVHPDGRLWVLMAVPPADWRAATAEERRRLTTDRATTPADRLPWTTTRLEFLDPRAGRVVASQILGMPAQGFAGPGLLYAVEETDAGDWQVVVWSLSPKVPRSGAR